MSPPGGSILVTSAPRSASIMVAYGPGQHGADLEDPDARQADRVHRDFGEPAAKSPPGCGISTRSARRGSRRSAAAAPTDRSPRHRRSSGTAPEWPPRHPPRTGHRRRGHRRGRAAADSSATSPPRPGCGWPASLAASISELAHRHTGMPATIRGGGRPAFVGGLVDAGRDVVTDRPLVGHPQHGAVGELTGDLQHHRPQRGDQHRQRRIRAQHSRIVHGERVVLDVDRARARPARR